MIGRVRAVFSKQTRRRRGSSEREQTALAVIPPGPAGPRPVMTETPVAK
jgi:hypothetical protein